jgi:pimeloyl-ACP methyl ester carboxylesterase
MFSIKIRNGAKIKPLSYTPTGDTRRYILGGKMKIIRYLPVIIILVLMFFSSTHAMKPIKNYIKTPSDYECRCDSASFTTSDNKNLIGWYIYSQLPESKKPTIIFSYGDAGNMSYFLDYAMELSTNGYNVLLYDYRGFGQSDDFEIDKDMLIYKEFLLDLDAAVNYVKGKYESEIVLFGHSMGATLSISVAGNREDISAVIAEGPYENTNEVLKRINLLQEKDNDSRRFKNESFLPMNSEPENAIKNFSNTAFYAFTGSEDEIVNADVVYKLYSSCPSKLKSMWVATGTDHGNIVRNQTELYFNNIYGFLDMVIGE